MPVGSHQLNDNEGTLLSLVLRIQPTTAYQLIKVYSESPVSNFKTGKGKIYPLITRLARLGYITKSKVVTDKRGTEELRCTERGLEAVREWVLLIRTDHILLDDPLRTKVQSFDLLTPTERMEWTREAKQKVYQKLEELDDYKKEVDVPYKDFVHENAVRSLRARLDWLEMLQLYFDRPAEPRASST